MHPLELSPRLKVIADMVPQGAALADIGSDHAYLPIYLLRERRICHAIAGDIHPEPLKRGEKMALAHGVDGIDFRLCDGLQGLAPQEADVIVIAGMGGETIAAILQAADWLQDHPTELLLQPMSKTEFLRQWLGEHGFVIQKEKLVQDRENLYVVMQVFPGSSRELSPEEVYGGIGLEHDPLWELYLQERIEKLRYIANGIRRGAALEREKEAAHWEELACRLDQLRKERINDYS